MPTSLAPANPMIASELTGYESLKDSLPLDTVEKQANFIKQSVVIGVENALGEGDVLPEDTDNGIEVRCRGGNWVPLKDIVLDEVRPTIYQPDQKEEMESLYEGKTYSVQSPSSVVEGFTEGTEAEVDLMQVRIVEK